MRYCPACKKKLGVEPVVLYALFPSELNRGNSDALHRVVDEYETGQGMFVLLVGMESGYKDTILNRVRVGKGAK